MLDMETLQITGDIRFDHSLQRWLAAAAQIAPRTFEIIVCSSHAVEGEVRLPPHVRMLIRPGLGYYALKSAGAAEARGKFLFFSDVDCRPGPDYIVRLLHYFDSGEEIFGGRTYYDGEDFLTRLNSAVSWGYLHNVEELGPQECYASHNLAVRRGAAPDYFGPYTERYGGDEYISSRCRAAGFRLPVHQDLKIYHESPAYSLRALLDRHFREVIRIAFMKEAQHVSLREMLHQASQSHRNRWNVFKRHAHKFGFSRRQWWLARLVLRLYSLLDWLAVFVLMISPSLYARWMAYHFGDLQRCVPVPRFLEQKTMSVVSS